jgi:hypothetical protein
MFKCVLKVGAVVSVVSVGLFTPIDPSVLKYAGLPGSGSHHTVDGPVTVGTMRWPSGLRSVSSNSMVDFRSNHRQHDTSPRAAAGTVRTESAALTAPEPIVVRTPRLTPVAPNVVAVDASPPVTHAIVRNLQSELRRVGCYNGRIDGDWGPASRFAMATFTRSVNAALPTDKPDHVLLALVQRHAGSACGAGYVAKRSPNQDAHHNAATVLVRASGWRTRVTVAKPPAAQPVLVSTPQLVRRSVVVRNAPRIVRSHNPAAPLNASVMAQTPAATASTQVNPAALSSSRQPYSYGAPRMALGVPTPTPQGTVTGQAPVAAPPAYTSRRRQVRSSARRRSSRSYRKYRRSRRSWQRRVTRGFDLSGS